MPAAPTNRWAGDEAVAWFGRYLYYETRLSSAGEFSCATCHDPNQGTGDGRALSEATGTTTRHAPALWNVVHQRWLYWDGRCDSLWCQATGPIEAELEMDMTRTELARVIAEEHDLRDAYTTLFGAPPDVSDSSRFPEAARPVPDDVEHPDQVAWDTMTPADQAAVTAVLVSITKAIAAYERTLVTTDTRVDRFIHALRDGRRTDAEDALSDQERWGLELFAGEGECVFCHSGWAFSNKEFHNLALPAVEGVDALDTGRYDGIDQLRSHPFNSASVWSDAPAGDAAERLNRIAQTTEQLGQFKTPGLREVASHAPYMHGGHFETLSAVVAFYAEPGLEDSPGHRDELVVARGWDAEEQAAVVAFLEALSSTEAPPPELIRAPGTALP
jgi:cytochrome c peroxidase